MLSDAAARALRDVAYRIELAASFAAGTAHETFKDDMPLRLYAVTRCLEIISEASRRLPEVLKARHPATEWREMAAGNFYRHEHEDVAARRVGDTLTHPLSPLRAAIDQELASLG